jgi:uroporphyrinogen-III synthase
MNASARRVLLTRPRRQNDAMSGRFRSVGIDPVELPLLTISERNPSQTERRMIEHLDRYDHIIVTSGNAVMLGLPLLQANWVQWPVHPTWYAVGPSTAAQLATFAIDAIVPPEASSEALLSLPALARIEAQNILIIRGVGGREVLGAGLIGRGAKVDHLPVYVRTGVRLQEVERMTLVQEGPSVVMIYSAETLDALVANLDGASVEGMALVVPSARVGQLAKTHGFQEVVVASPAEESMFAAALKLATA